jgi:hypothetical protein
MATKVAILWDTAPCGQYMKQRFGLHGAISRKIATFKPTAVRTSNPLRLQFVEDYTAR